MSQMAQIVNKITSLQYITWRGLHLYITNTYSQISAMNTWEYKHHTEKARPK